jgi:hypothetical protein
MYKLSLIFLVLFSFTGCTTKSTLFIKSQQCSFDDLKINQKNSFCASPRSTLLNNNTLYISFDNGAIVSWDLTTKKLLHIFSQTDFFGVRQLLLHNNKIYAASRSMHLKKYSLEGKLEYEQNYEKGSLFCLENSSKNIFVGFGNAQLGTIQSDTMQLIDTMAQHEYIIFSLYKDKNTLYSGADDNKLIVWEITPKNLLKKIKSINNFSSGIKKITKYKSWIFLGLGDGTLVQIDDKNNKIKYKTNKSNMTITSLISTENYLISGDADGNVTFYSLVQDKLQKVYILKLDGSIRSIIHTKDEYLIISKQGFIKKITPKEIEKPLKTR